MYNNVESISRSLFVIQISSSKALTMAKSTSVADSHIAAKLAPRSAGSQAGVNW